ncbi:ribosomal protein S5 domain 2-type protein [Pelagophyceae sp. CCMP2097]|nr:ribosomal protein S5 domain 2-type protein [Pelagophyceae sp. CCMP2097]|mmetsp:Transcript_14316/g.47845  ORF Transcript_14316/g.47845 Transcript_14316/m.47845 type:complete len:379 (+) Transcript_14316:48-1184(+)
MASSGVWCSAPGKVILLGEHSVVYGARAVAGALHDLRVYAHVDRRTDGLVCINLPDVGLEWQGDAQDLGCARKRGEGLPPPPVGAPRPAVLARARLALRLGDAESPLLCVAYLCAEICDTSGASITVVSHGLPVGAGLGSSAACAVATTAALLEAAQPGAAADLQVVNMWAFAAEIVSHGTPSGLDNYVSCHGGGTVSCRGGGAVAKEHGALRCEALALPELPLLVTDTRVPRRTRDLVERVGSALLRRPEATRALFCCIDAIVAEFAEACSSGRPGLARTTGELFRLNHSVLRALDVSHAALEDVAAVATEHGAPSTKLTGAGGGGCCITLLHGGDGAPLPAEKVQELCEALERRGYVPYRTRVGGAGVLTHVQGPP